MFSFLACTRLALKRLVNLTHPCVFSKNVFSKERVKLCSLFVTFNIIIFLKSSLTFLKSFRRYEYFFVNISYFQQFASIFWHFLVTKKLMTLACNKWCQHAFTFNIHQIDCLTIVHSYIDIRLAFLEMPRRRGGENYPKMPSLIRVSSYKINSLR